MIPRAKYLTCADTNLPDRLPRPVAMPRAGRRVTARTALGPQSSSAPMRRNAHPAVVVISAAGMSGVALWPADAAQSETRVWIRNGDSGCRYVPANEAAGARPCQS